MDLDREVPQHGGSPTPHGGLFSDFIHLSPDGHKLFAERLEGALREALEAQAQR